MAIYHLNVRYCSKSKGQSAQAKNDYINRNDKYSNRLDDLQFSGYGNMPKFAEDNPQEFWRLSDIYERANARVCTEIVFAFPRELTLEQQQKLVSSFIENTVDSGSNKLPYSFAIHNDKENNNPHCHLIFSERQLDGIDRTAEQFFKRANSKNAEKGGAKKTADFRDREFIKSVRTKWRELANEHLEKYGHAARIDERSYQDQGIDKDPRSRIDRVTWKELKYLESQEKQLGQEITHVVQKVAQEKHYEENKAQGMGAFSARLNAALNNKPPKSSVEKFSQKDDVKHKEQEKTSEKRKESVSQADFDMFIYKTIKNAERPKFEHERKIKEWEKSLKQLKSTYASYKGDLERVESENWGVLGLYQSKEQKAEIERIKGVMGDLSKQFDRTKGYIAEEQEKIEQINKQNKPLYERKAQIMQDNPNLIEKPMAQLHQEQFKRNAEKWEKEQKAKGHNRSISRDDGLSL